MSRSQARIAGYFGFQHLLDPIPGRWHLDWRKLFAVDDHFDLVSIEHFALKQGRRHAMHDVLVARQDLNGRLISGIDQYSNFLVDLLSGVFTEVAMLVDLTAQEDLLLLLAESDWTKRTHAELAHHAAG